MFSVMSNVKSATRLSKLSPLINLFRYVHMLEAILQGEAEDQLRVNVYRLLKGISDGLLR